MSFPTIYSYEIPILFNGLAEIGLEKNLVVEVPLMGNIGLFRLDVGGREARIYGLISFSEYREAYEDKLKRCHPHIREEFPLHDDLLDALFQAGILKPIGLEDLELVLERARAQPITKGGDIYCLAFDTNVVRDRLYSNYLKAYCSAPQVEFVLAETVRDELTPRRRKMKRETARYFVDTGCGAAIHWFSNQNILADRFRYLGFIEYQTIREETQCEQLPAAKGSGNPDEIIIDTYSDYARMGRKIVLLSRDNEMIRMGASLPNLIPVILEQPPKEDIPQQIDTPYPYLWEFLYILSVLYGRIEVKMGGEPLFGLQGVWSQKDVTAWEDEMLQVWFPKSEGLSSTDYEDLKKLQAKLAKSLKVLRAVKRVKSEQ